MGSTWGTPVAATDHDATHLHHTSSRWNKEQPPLFVQGFLAALSSLRGSECSVSHFATCGGGVGVGRGGWSGGESIILPVESKCQIVNCHHEKSL